MSRMGIGYGMAVGALGAVIVAAGLAVGGDVGRGVAIGAAVGVVVQVLLFWGLFVYALPGRPGLAHAIGVLVRFAVVGAVAFVGVAAAAVPPAPTLFSLVACLFASTLLEAYFIKRQDSEAVVGAARVRTQS